MKKVLVAAVLITIAFLGIRFLSRNTSTFEGLSNVIDTPDRQSTQEESADGDVPNFYTNAEGYTLPEGYSMSVYGDLTGVGAPRVLAADKNGDLYATLTRAGLVVHIPDANGDGIADSREVIFRGLNNPHGLVFAGDTAYLAESNQVVAYDFDSQNHVFRSPTKLFDLPDDGGHFTRTIKVIADKLYTSVGSLCNVCVEKDDKRATVLISNTDGTDLEVFAKGLRNSVFLTTDENETIWATEMGRDLLGDNLPPDEINTITRGDYGWPYCYGKQVRDRNFGSIEDEFCSSTISSKFDLPAHVAPLGLAFIPSTFSTDMSGDLLVALHGSWNSTVKVGYKVVKLKIDNGEVVGMDDFITGFLRNGNVVGRPVDVFFNQSGDLLISDDYADVVYIVTKDD